MTSDPGPVIDYKQLRKTNPEAARKAVLHYLDHVGGNKTATARAFGIRRSVVYDIVAKSEAGDLTDRSRAPHSQPLKTPKRIETRILRARNRTGYGYRRLARYLARRGLEISPATVRNVLQRNRNKLARHRRHVKAPLPHESRHRRRHLRP